MLFSKLAMSPLAMLPQAHHDPSVVSFGCQALSKPTRHPHRQTQALYRCNTASEHLDHGCLYAANSFFDTKTSKHIVWGWITEEDLCDDLRHEQGWSGLLSLPREIRLQTLESVVRAWKSDLKDITSVEAEPNSHNTSTVRTLASQPVQSVIDQLRQKASIGRARLSSPLLQQSSHDLAFTSDDVRTTAWELDCLFTVSKHCSNIGIQLVHSQGMF